MSRCRQLFARDHFSHVFLAAALGGRLTDVHGEEIIYEKGGEERNKGGVIAAVENLDYYLDRIPEEIKEELRY